MRRSGKTTRLVDEAVQHLFKEGSIRILLNHEIFNPHFFDGYSKKQIEDLQKFIDEDVREGNCAQLYFLKTLTYRLKYEHNGSVKMISRTKFKVIKP